VLGVFWGESVSFSFSTSRVFWEEDDLGGNWIFFLFKCHFLILSFYLGDGFGDCKLIVMI